MTKICTKCGQGKPLSEFYRVQKGRKITARCKACHNVQSLAWHRANPERARANRQRYATKPENRAKRYADHKKWKLAHPEQMKAWLRKSHLKAYGLTPEQYQQLYDTQQGRCGICRTWKATLHVDHNHNSERVRGLLCGPCNRGLGLFYDSILTLQLAVEYLHKGDISDS